MVNRRCDVLNRDRSINETFSSLRKEFKIMAIIEVQKIQKEIWRLEVLKSIDLSIERKRGSLLSGLLVLVNQLSYVA